MKIEILYIAECPTHPDATKLVRRVLEAQGVEAEIQEVLVSDQRMASEINFIGSPTIRVNGRDVAGEPPGPRSFGLCCRLYSGSSQSGLPPVDLIHQAVREAQQGRRP